MIVRPQVETDPRRWKQVMICNSFVGCWSVIISP
jgi:hypothetical protein